VEDRPDVANRAVGDAHQDVRRAARHLDAKSPVDEIDDLETALDLPRVSRRALVHQPDGFALLAGPADRDS